MRLKFLLGHKWILSFMNKKCSHFAHTKYFEYKRLHAGTYYQLPETDTVFPSIARSVQNFHLSFVCSEIITNVFIKKPFLCRNVFPKVFVWFWLVGCFQQSILLKMSASTGSACLHYLCPFICRLKSQTNLTCNRLNPGDIETELFSLWDYYSEKEM